MSLDPRIDAISTQYGLSKDDFWKLPQGRDVWLVKHAALEVVAAKAGIAFEDPQIIEANGKDGVVALYVRGHLDKRSVWSTGEANPKNCKTAYPWAIAEKRAIDRVVLKLVGLHGLVYSEEESDDFKGAPEPEKPVSSASLKKPDENGQNAWHRLESDLDNDMADCHSLVALNAIKDVYRARAKKDRWPAAWMAALKDRFEAEEKRIMNAMDTDSFPGDKPNTYANAVLAG